MVEKKSRQLNYELLRILAMLMIVCLHYLSKGGFLGDPAREQISMTGYAAWLIEAFCLVAVNVYVLISGYFGTGRSTNACAKNVLERPLRIWKQMLFYSVIIGAASILLGKQKPDIYRIFMYIFPTVTEHYWFATSYIILCLFMPFLDRGVEMLDKRNLERLLGAFLLIFCIAKTVIPMELPWDKYGYDAFWFVTLYLTGAYIRLYGVPFINSRLKAAALYITGALVIFISFLVIRRIYFASGSFEAFIHYAYSYNYLFCYLSAIGFFMVFSDGFSRKSDAKAGRLERMRKPIELVSGASFGVYLIHEHIDIRYLWVEWFHCRDFADAPLFVFLGHMIFTVITVYAVCTLIEAVRQKIAALRRYLLAAVLLFYPLRHAFTGIDFMDAGYALGNYRFFDTLNPMWKLATYLANVTGVLLSKLPFGSTWAGMNVYSGLLIGLAAASSFLYVCRLYGGKRRGNTALFFAAELCALSLCWAPNVILYHYLGYVLMTAAVIFLHGAIINGNKAGFALAGIILGVCVAVRMPNITYMAFILPLWYFCFIKKEKFADIAEKTLFCALGYAAGLFAPLAVISIKYGISAYPQMIASLFQVTETAVDYKPASMLGAMLGDYIIYSAWLALFVLYGILGVAALKITNVVFKNNSRNITYAIKILYIAGMAVLMRFCYGRGMFGLDYSSFFSMYKPVTVYLLVTLAACAMTLASSKMSEDLKLWAVFLLVIIFITPLGSNNGLYPIINNLFLAAPISVHMIAELFAGFKAKNNTRFAVISVWILIFSFTAFQSILFGCSFIFHDADAGKEKETIEGLRCSRAAIGLRTTAEKKQALESLDSFLFESGLNKERVILYGDIPAVSYIFDMEPAVFTTWADLDSNGADELSANLDSLYERGETPVVIIGKEAVKKRSETGKDDKKHKITYDFIEKSGYKKVYENSMFEVFYLAKKIYNDVY